MLSVMLTSRQAYCLMDEVRLHPPNVLQISQDEPYGETHITIFGPSGDTCLTVPGNTTEPVSRVEIPC